jgi:hypothetical protein
MNMRLHIAGLLGIAVILISTAAFAQDEETALPSETDTGEATTDEPEIRAGQEVEINEDNYRQFMELKDPNLQRNIIPENVFKPGSGLQKLDKLPEESQKHLRNQLREIIVQGDPWQPGDEETEYPYTPSAAASTDPALEKQELEAWGELVDSYHERESQIYENSSGMQAARGSEQGSNNSEQNGAGSSDRQGQNGEGSQGQQAGQEGNAEQAGSEGTYSLNGSADPSANGTAGVSQNAMEFLQGLGQGANGTGERSSRNPQGDGGQAESPALSDGQAQAQAGQQGNSGQGGASNSSTPNSPRESSTESTAGASQNAMEFLQGNTGQSEGSGDSGTASSAGNEGQSESQGGESQAEGQQAGTQQADAQGGDQGEAQAEGQQAGAQGDAQDEGQDNGQEGAQSDDQGDDHADNQDGEQSQESQQAEPSETSDPTIPPASSAAATPVEPEEESTAGASQNALEYLTGEDPRAIDSAIGEAREDQPEGTLSIQDLLNAQGIGDSTNMAPVTTGSGGEDQADEDKPEKDGGGR